MGRTVFVTGGAGYIGAHCCKAFATAGWNVVVYDNLSRGWRDFVRWGPLIEGDVLDKARLESALREVKPDILAHFAALAYVGESVEKPGDSYHNNSVGSLMLLEAMRACDVSRILFSSTCATYGTPVRVPIDESHPQNPINPYGWSKLFVEQMLADYSTAFDLRAVSLRYFNAAGADLDGEIGERHEPETHVIPLALSAALTGDSFYLFGCDFETRDGTAIRDYIHVNDLADAHLRALAYLVDGGETDAFNLGTGVGTSVAEIARAVERATSRTLNQIIAPRRVGDPPMLVAAADKAEKQLGWRPVRSDIDEIVASALRWHTHDDRR